MAAGYISPFSGRYNLLLNGRLALPTLAKLNDGASPLLNVSVGSYNNCLKDDINESEDKYSLVSNLDSGI